jgi:hypothetical protein
MSSTQNTEDEKMAAILGLLCSPEVGVARTGEKLLKPVAKKATCLMLLVNQLRCNPNDQCRQRAADLLQDYLPKYYFKLTATNQILMKDNLLPMVRNEANMSVAVSMATLVIGLAKMLFSKNQEWPELFIAIFQLGRSESDHHRILCFAYLDQLSEEVPEKLQPHMATLANMYLAGMQDTALNVAAAALNSLTAFIEGIGHSNEVLSLKPLLSPLLEVVQTFAVSGYVVGVIGGLDVISQSVHLEVPLINDHIPDIVIFLISVLQNEMYDMKMRSAAAEVLQDIMQHRPKLFCKSDLVNPVLGAVSDMLANGTYTPGSLFLLGRGSENDEAESDNDDASTYTYKLSRHLMDQMAIFIPSAYFLEPALKICGERIQSADIGSRRSGCAMLGIIVEGCNDLLRPLLSGIVPPLVLRMADTDSLVREIACFAVGQLAEHCQPEILHFHAQMLPAICQAIQDGEPMVAGIGAYCCEMYVEQLSAITLRPFLQPLLLGLGELLQSQTTGVVVGSLSAIGAIAVATESNFLPFTEVSTVRNGCLDCDDIIFVVVVIRQYVSS